MAKKKIVNGTDVSNFALFEAGMHRISRSTNEYLQKTKDGLHKYRWNGLALAAWSLSMSNFESEFATGSSY
jgi:hypothetical protein